MKTKEQLNALKAEVGTMNKMFSELTENDFEQVSGEIGAGIGGAIQAMAVI